MSGPGMDAVDSLRRTDNLLEIICSIVFSIIGFCTVFGNSCVIIVILKYKSLQIPSNYFILSLACTDLSVGLVGVPVQIVSEMLGYWPFGGTFCVLWFESSVLVIEASIFHLMIISFDRYLTITNFAYSRNRNRKRMLMMIA